MVARTISQLRPLERQGGKHERAPEGALGETYHGEPGAYLITCSVLASKKWIRSGMKVRRTLSCDRVLTVGSTRATICCPAALVSRRISAPSGSTTSTTASKDRSGESEPAPTRRSSGRTPSVTPWPL